VPSLLTSALPLLRRSPRRRRCAILALHDVRDAGWLRGFLSAMLRDADPVPLRELVDAPVSRRARPRFALTFDDGYRSVRTVVSPVCAELGVPYTTFVCGEVLAGGPAPWYDRVGLLSSRLGLARAAALCGVERRVSRLTDLLSASKAVPLPVLLDTIERAEARHHIDPAPLRARYMDGHDLAAVAHDPRATIGSHTYRHPILSHLDRAEQRREIENGIDALQRAGGVPIEFFAYPNGKPGDYDAGVIDLLRSAGIRAAVTTTHRPLNGGDDPMRLPRLGVSEGDPPGRLEMKWSLPWFSVGDLREQWWRRTAAPQRRAIHDD
jgi:peptidoglycan/xylan/chitin deacetylase (PgdA/CDA1 family)